MLSPALSYARGVATWLLILSDATAARWLLDKKKMAFRASAHADRIRRGDHFALYISRAAHKNPTRDEAQIVAVGVFTSRAVRESVEVAGHRFEETCGLRFEASLPLRAGVSFSQLVEALTFIRVKNAWAAYVRRTLVPIPDADFQRIATTVKTAANSRAFEGTTT